MNRKIFFLKYKISTKQFAHIRLSSGQLNFRAEFTQAWPFFSANNASVFTSCLDETGYTHATKKKLDKRAVLLNFKDIEKAIAIKLTLTL